MIDLETIAIFGGTFDPVHNGHLCSAQELKQHLRLGQLRLLPCHLPPHRQLPGASSQQRLEMVRLAARDSGLLVDDRELQRQNVSFSIETLEQLRQELGGGVSLSWVMGSDALAGFNHWHRWQDFLQLVHIIVIARPGQSLPEHGPVAELVSKHRATRVEQLWQQPTGLIWFESLSPYPISATEIRQRLATNQPVAEYLPAGVLHYIKQQGLYQ